MTEMAKKFLDTLRNRFTYHPPGPDDQKKYEAIRFSGLSTARLLHDLCPPSRELSVALTKLDEVVMWANASIARKDGP